MVAAQSAPVPSTECSTCIGTTVQNISSCKNFNFDPSAFNDPSHLTDAQKQCVCSIVAVDWASKCLSQCGADVLGSLSQAYASLNQYCQGVSTSKSSASTVKATGIVMAVGAALAQALL
ncbi:hypothetical protein BGZ65_008908 [Modicella reniformis]|uniref:Uncharacterized protein n=1 Tax=Modicella reniformis TaxID=1440133 RepID=A0A9P6SVN9_9FUNG|nr:hypothetical protein BGZ65_008908 [Modicella reniformis]